MCGGCGNRSRQQYFLWILSRSINAQHDRSFIDVRLHLLNLPAGLPKAAKGVREWPSQIARFPFNVLSVG